MDGAAITKSSFSFVSDLLPKDQRQASRRLYAACRSLDDLADGGAPDRAAACLGRVARDLSRGPEAGGRDAAPEARAFLDLAASHELDLEAAGHLVRTLKGDIRPARLETKADLLAYAQGAAGTVGEMMSDLLCPGGLRQGGRSHAADLGIAMQLTNIARDVAEDAAMGRRYLPGEWCPLPPEALAAPDDDARQTAERAIVQTLSLAEGFYARATKGYASLPFRTRIVIAMAAERYREIGLRIARRPDRVWRGRFRPGRMKRAQSGLRGLHAGMMARASRDRPGHA